MTQTPCFLHPAHQLVLDGKRERQRLWSYLLKQKRSNRSI
jgi:hypothetical protein